MNLKGLLPNLPFLKSSASTEVFFALDICSDKVTAAIWMIRGRHLLIINSATAKYSSEHELTDASNRALDEVLGDMELNPTKVLLGVPDFWLRDDNLKDEYLKLLRSLTKDLELEPMAFVSVSHAISHFLQKQTGVPTTAVLINYGDPLVVSVVKAGKIVGSKEMKRSEDLAFDLEKALASFDEVEVLPSRILVFGQSKSAGMKEKLVSFPWMAKLPFLHIPKIDMLDESVSIQAVCFAGASEINPDVSYNPQAFGKGSRDESILHKGVDLKNPGLEKAGFVAGDIGSLEDEEMVFDHERDGDSYHPDESYKSFENEGAVVKRGRHQPMMAPPQMGDETDLATRRSLVPGVGGVLGWPRQLLGGGTMMGKLFIILPVLAMVGLVAAYILLVKVHVTIFIDAKVLEKDAQVIADPSITAVDEGGKKIPGKVVETSVTDTGKGSASGKKQIGDPAKGKVIVYNKTDSSKSLSKGTLVSSSNGIKFSLDSSILIASQSATPGPNFQTIITPGKSDSVGATAVGIGPDGNLSAGSNLTVAGFADSQVIAQVDTAFSGGTSKDITVVTADDQKKLLAVVASTLRGKAREQIQGKLTGDNKILEEGLVENITSQKYSKNVGDQASEFSLTLSINYKGTSYSDNDLKTMVAKSIETTVPEGFQLNLADSETQAAANKVEKDGKLYFNAKFKAKLVPKIDLEKLKKEIKLKPVKAAADIIKKIDSVIGTEFVYSPKIPSFMQLVPILSKNITIEITAK